ncbi:hypothetical protein GPJ56_000287 [Histomonas meleagridis]|uniref:uncharacterized protein n=1 Tax=Histomonas meleagridis TaxID=135588 RepID=UPI00355A5980|nr:hypothetical protein GPJ56_000287 [Histomonas meleagridis]KAH0806805.1 hypothetical protein GO595_000448 [Histomonas meleagridis]
MPPKQEPPVTKAKITSVFNIIRRSTILRTITNADEARFKQEISNIEKQLAIVDLFSHPELLDATQTNSDDFNAVKNIYENRTQIIEALPRYKKLSSFSTKISIVSKNKEIMEKTIADPENVKISPSTLQQIKTQLPILLQQNDKFDDLTYYPAEKLREVLKCQKIAVEFNDKVLNRKETTTSPPKKEAPVKEVPKNVVSKPPPVQQPQTNASPKQEPPIAKSKITSVFNAIQRSAILRTIINADEARFKQEISNIEKQLSNVDLFSHPELLDATQVNNEDFNTVKKIYENRVQIAEALPRYKKLSSFSTKMSIISRNKEIMEKAIADPVYTQIDSPTLQQIKTQLPILLQQNDKFDDLTYYPSEKLKEVLAYQKIAVEFNDKVLNRKETLVLPPPPPPSPEASKNVVSKPPPVQKSQTNASSKQIPSVTKQQITVAFNTIRRSTILRYIVNTDIDKFGYEIANIEEQLSNVDLFSHPELLDATQVNNEDFNTVKKIYENRVQIAEALPRYKKLSSFSTKMSIVSRNKEIMEEVIADPEHTEIDPPTLQQIKTQLPILLQQNDKFDDLTYYPAEKLREVLEYQKIAVEFNEKVLHSKVTFTNSLSKETTVSHYQQAPPTPTNRVPTTTTTSSTPTPNVNMNTNSSNELSNEEKENYLLNIIEDCELSHPLLYQYNYNSLEGLPEIRRLQDNYREKLYSPRTTAYNALIRGKQIRNAQYQKYLKTKDEILQYAYATGDFNSNNFTRNENDFSMIIKKYKSMHYPDLKKEFDNYLPRASSEIEYYNGCKEIVEIVDVFLKDEAKELRQKLNSITKPKGNEVEIAFPKAKSDSSYKEDIERSISEVKEFYQTMKTDSKLPEMNYFKLLSLINGVIAITKSEPEYQKYYNEIQKFFESVKNEIKTGIKPKLTKELNKAKMLISIINSPPKPTFASTEYFKKFNQVQLVSNLISYYISNVSLLNIVLDGGVDILDEFINFAKENETIKANDNQYKILEEAESCLETNPLIALKMIPGLWRNYSFDEKIRNRCVKIIKNSYEKIGRIPYSEMTPTTYIYSENDPLRQMIIEPMFECDYYLEPDARLRRSYPQETKTMDYYLKNAGKFAECLMNLIDLKIEIQRNINGFIHPAYLNPYLLLFPSSQMSERLVTLKKSYLSEAMSTFGQKQAERSFSNNLDIVYLLYDKSDFRVLYSNHQFDFYSMNIYNFFCKISPLYIKRFSEAIDNFQEQFNQLPKRKPPTLDGIDRSIEHRFEELVFNSKDITPFQTIITEMFNLKKYHWTELLRFCKVYRKVLEQMKSFITFYKDDKVFEPHYQVLYNIIDKTHIDLLNLVLKFHEKYTNKIMSEDDGTFMSQLARYGKIHNEIVKKIYENVNEHWKANKEALKAEEKRYQDVWAKQSLERQKFMKEKFIDTIKEGTKLIIKGKEYIGKHVDDYVRFASDDDYFTIAVSKAMFTSCSVVVNYENGPYDLQTLLFPYNDLRGKFGPEHYHAFFQTKETRNVLANISQYCLYDFSTAEYLKDTPNCKNGGIDEKLFKIITYSYDHFEEIELDNLKNKNKKISEEIRNTELRLFGRTIH